MISMDSMVIWFLVLDVASSPIRLLSYRAWNLMILHLGCVLGRLGSLLGRLVGVKPIIPRSRSTKIEDSLCLLGRLAGVLGMAWAFGGFLKLFGPSWGRLGNGRGVSEAYWAVRLAGVLGMG